MVRITAGNFPAQVLNSERPVFVEFGADWCKPCVAVNQIMEDLERSYGQKALFATVDVAHAGDVAAAAGVRGLPTVVAYVNGEPAARVAGSTDAAELGRLVSRVVSGQVGAEDGDDGW